MDRAGEGVDGVWEEGWGAPGDGASPIFSGYTLSGTFFPTLTKALLTHAPLEMFLHLKHKPLPYSRQPTVLTAHTVRSN